ncbi:Putative potassium channel regulatory protein unc-93 [Caenorhabditis elegans]|nr:Putative potassium channel regulatory protein unc-93 [Caenorhabditis elegans]CAA45761.1 unc-93 [Caenorhabditis elegans]CAB03760.3 Putative potassium channel regulatory protein unc-93 [Caenorhabditis elegans]|eukprot:NP_001021219.1 Putative potassium channel regulatory protein unc-93 [Caenorhabditis elegans]
MGDSNTWDLVGEQQQRKKSRSPSRASRVDSELLVGVENAAELEALGLGKEQLEEEARRHKKQRSKSPALENIRKTSIHLLQKFGAIPKKKDDSVLLFRFHDIPDIPLESLCIRPKEFFEEPKVFSFRDMGREQQKAEVNEKCSYLFRGTSFDHDDHFELPTETGRVPEYDHFCPIHGSRRRLPRNKLVTMQTLMHSVDDEDNEDLAYIYGHDFLAKLVRKKKREMMSGTEKERANKIKRKIMSNLWILSVAFLFLFTAFNGLQNLQTSVNGDLGSDSLVALYLSLAISSLFVPSFMINRLGCKLTFLIAIFVYFLYIVINLRPTYSSMIPASIFCGIAASCIWGAKCAYITEMGIRYASLNFESQTTVIVRFFGYFFMIVHCGQVVGNMVSSYIFTLSYSQALRGPEDSIYDSCGYQFPKNLSDLTELAESNLARPPQKVYVAVCLAYLACVIISGMIMSMFLNALAKDARNRKMAQKFNSEIFYLMLKHLINIKFMLLVPLTIFNGLEQAFLVGVYTKAFVGCGLGIWQIGFVMACFGISDAVCSLVFGPLIKLFGRMPLFVFGAVVNLLMIVTLMVWPLNAADTQIFYVVAAMWGMADGVWNTQINGFWVALVGRQSLQFAFTKYRFWESLGIAIGFALIRHVTVEIYLLITFFMLLLGMCGFLAIENFDHIIKFWHHLIHTSCPEKEPLDDRNSDFE